MESGVAFTMINAILFAYLRTKDGSKKFVVIVASVVIGFVMAIISTIIRDIPNFINRTNLSFLSMIPTVLALVVILLMIILNFKKEKNDSLIFENIFIAFVMLYSISSFFYYLPAVLLQINKFVYYGETALSTMVLFRIIGYALGILIMILSAILVYNTAHKLSKKELDVVVFVSLFIFGITQMFVIIQRLYSIRILPKNDMLFGIIAWVVNNTSLINLICMLFFLFLPALLYSKNIKIKEKYRNNAELRKIKYFMRKNRNLSKFFLFIIIINIMSITTVKSFANRDIALSAPEDYAIEEKMIVVPLSELEDGHLHRYSYKASDGVNMRFFLIKKSEGSYGVVLDACEICGPSGYFERGNDVVCKLCDVVMNRGTIGFKGGCNPIPIPYIVHDEKIKIDPIDLDKESSIFK